MKAKLARLINVKSIVTLVLTGVFSYLAIIGSITADNFMTIFTVVIAFYFGVVYQKNTTNSNDGGADGE